MVYHAGALETYNTDSKRRRRSAEQTHLGKIHPGIQSVELCDKAKRTLQPIESGERRSNARSRAPAEGCLRRGPLSCALVGSRGGDPVPPNPSAGPGSVGPPGKLGSVDHPVVVLDVGPN